MDGPNKTAEDIMGEIQDLRQIIADFESEDTALEDLKEQFHEEIEDHKRDKEDLRISEERFRLLYEMSPLGYQSLDADGNLIEVNPAWLSLLGYEKEEVIGRAFADFLASGFGELFKERFPCFKAAGEACSVPFVMVRADGSHIDVEIDGKIGYNPDGSFKQTHCVLHDVTERKKTQEKLRQSEERFHLAVEGASDGMWDWPDVNSEKEWWSSRWYELLGYEDGEIEATNSNFKSFLHPDDLHRTEEAVLSHFERRVPFDLEYRLRTKSGEYRWFRARAQALWDADGKPCRMSGSIRDITDRKQAKQELEKIFNIADYMICVGDLKGNFTRVNDSFEQILGYTSEELLGQPYTNLVHPDDKEKTLNVIKNEMSQGTKIIGFENRYRCKDGTYKWLSWTSQPDPETGVAYAVARDITDRKKAEDKLRKSEQEYRSTLNNLLVGVIVHASDSSILLSNVEATNILGLTHEQMKGKKAIDPAWNFVHEDSTIMKVEDYPVSKVLSTKKPLHDYVVGVKRPDKDNITWVIVNAMPVFINDSEVEKVVVNFVNITERKQAERKVNESEERFRRAVINSPFPIMIHAEDGEVLQINKVWTELTGYRAEEIPTLSEWIRLAYGERKDLVKSRIDKIFDCEKRVDEGEYVVSSKDGDTLIWDFSSASLGRLPDGRRVVISMAKDVTERKKAEETLKQEVLMRDTLLDNLPCIAMILKKETREIVASNEAARKVGAVPGQTCFGACVHREDPCPWCRAPELWATNEPKRLEVKHRGVHYEGIWVPLTDDLYVHYIFDITARKQAKKELRNSEESLKESERWLKKAQSISRIGHWHLYPETGEISGSDELFNIFGLDPDEATLGAFASVVHPEDREYDLSHIQRGIEKGLPWDIEYRLLLKDGTIKTVHAIGEPVTDEKGKTVYIVGTTQDITERKRAENELQEAKQRAEAANIAKSQFLANMSHEIRTPMSIITGFADLLRSEEDPDEQKSYVDLIQKAGKSLLRIIDEILDVSRIEAGKLEIKIEDCSLDKLIDGIEVMMRPLAREEGLQFDVFRLGRLPDTIQTDSGRLRQCLLNLIGNAIKFTERGHVHLKVSACDMQGTPCLRFDVEDTGIGIPQDKHVAVFDTFSQADGSHTRQYGGTGLGLTITKQLAQLLGGVLSFSSEEGKGSVFSLVIPASVDAELSALSGEGAQAKDTAAESAITDNLQFFGKVLVAEDAEGCQVLAERILQRYGLDVVIVDDGKEAIEKARLEQFDLILMDIQMPGLNGIEATKQLREEGITTPIVALTAYAMPEDRANCIEAGCDDYISKPIDQDELRRVLSKYVAAKSASA